LQQAVRRGSVRVEILPFGVLAFGVMVDRDIRIPTSVPRGSTAQHVEQTKEDVGSIPKMGLIKAAEFQWMAKNPGKIRVP
jgi:hypothetical protein